MDGNPLGELSPCALHCLQETVPQVSCGLTDIPCQCASTKLIKLTSNCMVASCTMAESLHLIQVDAVQCNRPRNNHHQLIVGFAISVPVVTFTMIILRILSRMWIVRKLWWDDCMHIIAGAFAVPLTVFANLCSNHGFGYHLYDIKGISVSKMSRLLFWWYICIVLWPCTIFFIKMSILFLYLRVFPTRTFRVIVYISMGVLTISFLILLPMAIWQCRPIRAIWDQNINNPHCLSISNIAYANAAVNIATEIMIFVLPLLALRKLHIPRKKKIALFCIFGVGVIVIGIATARLATLSNVGTNNDATYSQITVYVLSCAETGMAHVCAAAPAVYQATVRIKRNIFPVSDSDSVPVDTEQRFQKQSSPHAGRQMNGRTYTVSLNSSDLSTLDTP